MIVRALNSSGDWLFGAGVSNYLSQNAAVAQTIQTRLNAVLGTCFFDLGAGVNWFNLLGAKNQTSLNLAISTVILNTPQVTGILQLSSSLNAKRQFSCSYQVQTVYSTVSSNFVFNTSIG